jgi:hypothetical protein
MERFEREAKPVATPRVAGAARRAAGEPRTGKEIRVEAVPAPRRADAGSRAAGTAAATPRQNGAWTSSSANPASQVGKL